MNANTGGTNPSRKLPFSCTESSLAPFCGLSSWCSSLQNVKPQTQGAAPPLPLRDTLVGKAEPAQGTWRFTPPLGYREAVLVSGSVFR